MRTTKRQLRRIIREQIEGHDPHEFMEKITAMDDQIQELSKGIPFRSVEVHRAIEDLRKAFLDLGTGMRGELKQIEMLGD